MHLMVYAAYGRAGIYMMQDYCRLLEVSSAEAELRDLATSIGALSTDHPIACVRSQAKDFRHPDALADALLHPRDSAYTVPELYDWLERCGMSFGRWFQQAAYLPHCGTMTKHNLIAYRDDRIGDNQPIAFDRDGWQDYVPLRRPGTVDVREQVPPDCVAVLANRARSYRDLGLPIDTGEERLFDAIDGKCTIGEIARIASEESCGARVRRFFERLWQYDHVVFDLTAR
jgi:hypothetical protein